MRPESIGRSSSCNIARASLCARLPASKEEPPGRYGLPWPFIIARDNERTKMPKLKTKSGVMKRFKLTATGKIKHGVAGKRHRLISHNAKYIRQNRGTTVLSKADTATVKAWAPYGLN
jgi:large subunit ribosomal protein L35